MKLDPEAFKRGKDKERRDRQRVVAGREESGNAFLSGRELAIEDALASKAHIDALAVALRRGGLPGTLQQLRVLAFNDLTQGRDPRDRLTSPGPAGTAGQDARQDQPAAGGQPGGGDGTGGGDDDASWDGCPDMPEWQHERRGTPEDDDHDGTGAPPGPPAPFPALINLTVPAGTAYGWSDAPGDAGGWGLTDPDDTRRLLQAASAHPRTRCASPSWPPTAPPPRTAAPAAPTPGYPRRPAHHETVTGPTNSRPRRSPTSSAASTSPSPRSPRAPATTPAAKTATPPAGNSSTWSVPAPHGAPPPAAAPRPSTATWTTPSPTPPGSPASATWPPPAAATTDASKPPAGSSPSPNPASCAGPHPPGAATPPGLPSTSNEDPACACLLAGALAVSG